MNEFGEAKLRIFETEENLVKETDDRSSKF